MQMFHARAIIYDGGRLYGKRKQNLFDEHKSQ